MTPHEHACFEMGLVGGIFLCIGIACLTTLIFILAAEGWPVTPGRLIAGWRNRR